MWALQVYVPGIVWMPEKTPGRVRFSQGLYFTTNRHFLYLWLSLSGPLGGGRSRSCQDSSVLLLCLSSFPQVPLHGRSRPSTRGCHRFTRPGQLLLWAGGLQLDYSISFQRQTSAKMHTISAGNLLWRRLSGGHLAYFFMIFLHH